MSLCYVVRSAATCDHIPCSKLATRIEVQQILTGAYQCLDNQWLKSQMPFKKSKVKTAKF